MGHHLTREGEFRSDKYPPCGGGDCGRPRAPIGYFLLKIADPNAWPALLKQAETTPEPELADDLRQAVEKAMREFGKMESA